MRRLTLLALLILVGASAVTVCVNPAYAVGKYCLAYWRECGAYENQAPPAGSFGNHSCYIHVWNENGTPRSGVPIYTSWGVYMGTTDVNGYAEAVLFRPNGYDFQANDGSSLSDTSPKFNEERAPNWGHYSFEVGFMYKSDSGNPGTFDTNYDGVLNSSSDQPCNLDAPRSRSLAYHSTNPYEYCSDSYSLGNWSDSFGQTFVANGNRVVAARCHATIGGGGHLWYSATIHSGGPNGPQIGPAAMSREVVSDEYSAVLLNWGINDVPVTPGQTYYVKFTRAGGMNIYHVNTNNYMSGQYYENTTPFAATDLEGIVVCGSVPQNGAIAGNVKDSLGRNMSGVSITTSTGGYSATTDASGNYSIPDVASGVYSVTASKSGFTPQTIPGQTVSVDSTTTVNFTLTDASAPPAPSVTDDGAYTANLSQLHATWSASDPESGIAEHSYAIGTSPGASNVVGWTSTGMSASVTKSVTLTPGTTYYFSVKAKNGAGSWSAAGSSDGITAAETMSIAAARTRVNGAVAALMNKAVSRKGSGCFWIEDADRTGGIKVNAPTSAAEGSSLTVCGVLSTDSGERAITAPEISNVTAGTAVKPLGMSGAALAGRPLGGNIPGCETALGPNNVGLLVTCWGEVVAQDSEGFSMSDGGREIDVTTGSLAKPADGMFVRATGISGLAPDGAGYSPVLRVLKQDDLTIIPRDSAFGSITGRVTSNGNGVSGASVSTDTGGYSTTTDSGGYYTLSHVAEGFYTVTASKSGYISASQNVSVARDAVTACDLAIIPNIGTISGVVRDGGGAALGGATVSTTTGGYTTTTASDGSYSLLNVAPGTYTVVASKSGYNSSTQTGKIVTANTTTTVDFTLTIMVGTIAGNVKSSTGVNLSGVTVLTDTGGYSATTDANGNYTISSVLPGTYSVTASKTGYNSSTQTGKVVIGNSTTTVNFTLTANTVTVYIDNFNGTWVDGPIGKMPSGWSYFGMGSPANTWRETARVLPPNDGTNSSYNVTMQGYCDWQDGSIIIYRNFRPNDWAAAGTTIDWSKPVYIKADVLGNDRGVGTIWRTWCYLTSYERTNGTTEWGDNGFTNGTWQTTTCTLTAGMNNGTVTGQLIVEVYFDFRNKKFDGFNDLVWENLRMEYTPVGGVAP